MTAEEKGLVGTKYLRDASAVSAHKTVANINMDGINQWGKTSDFTVIGLGNSTLDDVLAGVLKAENRTVRPDAEPEKGFYYRSDHFEFAKQGVPALDIDAGIDFIGKPADYGMKKRDEYTEQGLPSAVRRSEAGLGSLGRGGGHARAVQGRDSVSRSRTRFRSGSPAPSSRRSAIR